MGLREIFPGQNIIKIAQEAVESDSRRRQDALRRVDLYRDNCRKWLDKEIENVFSEGEVIKRVKAFSKMACSQSIFKRIIDELSRPVYARPPVRKISPKEAESAHKLLASEIRLDQKRDVAVRLVNATNAVFEYYRYSTKLQKVVLELLTPNMVTVISHPDDMATEAAIIVDRIAFIDGEKKTVRVCWDDVETFQFTDDGKLVEPPKAHNFEQMPFVPIHRTERWGGYWDETGGEDLENAQLAVLLLMALVLKLHKSQGEKQPLFEGDTGGMSKKQVLDGESPLVAPDGVDVSLLDFRSDARHYTDTIEKIGTNAGSSRGLNRERMAAKTTNPADDTALVERRDDIIKVFTDGEQRGFKVLKMVSQLHDDLKKRIPENATLKSTNFGEMAQRYDTKTKLEIWDVMERAGYRSVLDNIRELNPEIKSEDEAREFFLDNMSLLAWRIKEQRALNAPQKSERDGVGLTPTENGSMGPMVRDGEVDPNKLAEMQERGRAEEPLDA